MEYRTHKSTVVALRDRVQRAINNGLRKFTPFRFSLTFANKLTVLGVILGQDWHDKIRMEYTTYIKGMVLGHSVILRNYPFPVPTNPKDLAQHDLMKLVHALDTGECHWAKVEEAERLEIEAKYISDMETAPKKPRTRKTVETSSNDPLRATSSAFSPRGGEQNSPLAAGSHALQDMSNRTGESSFSPDRWSTFMGNGSSMSAFHL
jgi:hypothetical protein